jgi:prepilin-type N-terminal cleavage/methylation domain-containing protein
MNMKSTPQSGFTLVELLVVLAVIALLAAILLPSLTLAKLKAQRVQCAGNLHQLGIGLQVIVANDRAYPLLSGGTNSDSTWINQLAIEGLGMTQSITNYLGAGVWHCPRQWITGKENYFPLSYGYNSGGNIWHPDVDGYFGLCSDQPSQNMVKDSQVIHPADMIAIGELFNARIELVREPSEGSNLIAYQRHQGIDNVVFCDGHVESIKLKYLFADTSDAALSRWNRDHLPHRELISP